MADNRLRVAGVSLVVKGGEQFRKDLNQANNDLLGNARQMDLLDEQNKRNANSTEYLSKKQEMLSEQLETQRKRTEAMKKVRDEAVKEDKLSETQLAKLNAGIAESERKEASYANQIADTKDKMAKLNKESEKAAEKTRILGEKVSAFGTKAEKASKKTAALSAACLGLATLSAKSAIEFEDTLYQLATLPDVDVGDLEQMGKDLLEGSNAANMAASELSNAAYQAVSAGVAGKDAAAYVTDAAKAAKVGMTDVTTVVDGTTSAINAWGLSAKDSASIMGKFLTAQNDGKTTMGELASSIGAVTGVAPQLSMSLDEVLAATAALTKQGMGTSESMNGLKAVLSNVLKPTAEASKAAKAMGLDFSAAALQSKGFTDFLADVMDKTGGDADKLAKLFGSVEGLSKIMSLGGAAAGDYAASLEHMGNSASVLEDSFGVRMQSKAQRLSASVNRLKNEGIEFGDAFSPVIDRVSGMFGSLADWASGMDEGTASAVAGLLMVGTAVSPVLGAVGKLSKAAPTLIKMFTGTGGLITLAVAGVGALAYACATAKGPMAQLDDAMRNLKFAVPESSKKAVTDGINEGIAEADTVHAVTVTVTTEIDSLTEQQDTTFEDGKITKKEKNALTKALNKQVDDALADNKAYIKSKKEEYVAQLLTLTDGDGQPLYTEETANAVAEQMTAKTQEMCTRLDQARVDYNALLTTIYKSGASPTATELEKLNALMEQIKQLEIVLGVAQQGVDELAKAKEGRVLRGTATEQEFGTVLGNKQANYNYDVSDIQSGVDDRMRAAQKQIDTAQAIIDAGGVTGTELAALRQQIADRQAEIDAAQAEGEAQIAAVTEQYNADIAALYEGMAAANPEAQAALTVMAELHDNFLNLYQVMSGEGELSNTNANAVADYISKTWPVENVTAEDVRAALAGENDALLLTVRQGMGRVADQITDAMMNPETTAGLTENPMLAYVQSMLDGGTFDTLDVSKLDGALGDAIKTLDVTAKGEELGSDIADGVSLGIGTDSAISSADADKLRDATIAMMRAAFGSHSPARKMIPLGEDITAGVGVGMSDDTATAALDPYVQAMRATLSATLDAKGIGKTAGGDMMAAMASAITDSSAAALNAAADIRAKVLAKLKLGNIDFSVTYGGKVNVTDNGGDTGGSGGSGGTSGNGGTGGDTGKTSTTAKSVAPVTVNVSIGKANMTSANSVRQLATDIADMQQRVMAGVGM